MPPDSPFQPPNKGRQLSQQRNGSRHPPKRLKQVCLWSWLQPSATPNGNIQSTQLLKQCVVLLLLCWQDEDIAEQARGTGRPSAEINEYIGYKIRRWWPEVLLSCKTIAIKDECAYPQKPSSNHACSLARKDSIRCINLPNSSILNEGVCSTHRLQICCCRMGAGLRGLSLILGLPLESIGESSNKVLTGADSRAILLMN